MLYLKMALFSTNAKTVSFVKKKYILCASNGSKIMTAGQNLYARIYKSIIHKSFLTSLKQTKELKVHD